MSKKVCYNESNARQWYVYESCQVLTEAALSMAAMCRAGT